MRHAPITCAALALLALVHDATAFIRHHTPAYPAAMWHSSIEPFPTPVTPAAVPDPPSVWLAPSTKGAPPAVPMLVPAPQAALPSLGPVAWVVLCTDRPAPIMAMLQSLDDDRGGHAAFTDGRALPDNAARLSSAMLALEP